VTIAYTFCWRMQSEVLTLERRQVDLAVGTLRLDPGTTKNGTGHVVYMPHDLKRLLAAQVERIRDLERSLGRVIPFLVGRFRGARYFDFRKARATACADAGVAGMLRHDFRRTAVSNMVNAGVPERAAMTATGHKTRAVFDQDHIVSPANLQDVARKLTGTATGTIRAA
jgi:integrase